MSHAQDASSRASAPELHAGEVIACRYVVGSRDRVHPLGELYCCHDRETGKVVSLQRLRREFSLPGVRDRLFETRGSASLHSTEMPEILRYADILDYGEDIDGRTFLVTPWSEHPSLDTVERPLGFVEAATIVERVATALAPLHAQGLLHGGIEPASVLVDAGHQLTGLLGFGLAPALAAAAERGRALPLLAAPAYAAPELITGQPLGPQTDVYALGILLWELVFGQPPFRGATLRVLDSHVHRELPDFELPVDAPAGLEWVLGWMLAKDPADRFADAGKVAEQLRALVLEAPVAELELSDVEAIDEPEVVEEPSVEVRRMQPITQAVAELSDTFDLPRSRVWPKLALVLGMCTSLVALGIWGLGRDRTEVAADQTIVDPPEPRALASASRIEPPTSEAVARPPMQSPPTLLERSSPPSPTIEQPRTKETSLRKISSSKFRARKQELYAGVQRSCIEGGVRRTLEVAVRVDERGRVEAATVLGKMGASTLGQCVERQARRLDFPASREGGYYVYTLRLRP